MAKLTVEKLNQISEAILAALPEETQEYYAVSFNGTAVYVAAKTGMSLQIVKGAMALLEDEGEVNIYRPRKAPWSIGKTKSSVVESI